MPAQVIQEKNLAGQIEKAQKLLKELEERANTEYIPPICFYLCYKNHR
jgi:hypothetical protein